MFLRGSFELFLAVLAVTSVVAISATILSQRKGMARGAVLKAGLFICLPLAPIAGLAIGSFISHGFDIPWWLYGIVVALANMLFVFLTVMGFKLVAHLRRSET